MLWIESRIESGGEGIQNTEQRDRGAPLKLPVMSNVPLKGRSWVLFSEPSRNGSQEICEVRSIDIGYNQEFRVFCHPSRSSE